VAIDPENLAGTAKLTFADEFDTLSLWNGSSGTWATNMPWGAENGSTLDNNGDKEWFINSNYAPTASVRPWTVSSGVLSLTTDRADPSIRPYINNYEYTSGLINSYYTFSQQYGYFEIRAQLPEGQGFLPAFWLVPTDGRWPPEVDIFEVLGHDPTTIYYGLHSMATGVRVPIWDGPKKVADLSVGFHTIGFSWSAETVTFYVDGQQIFTAPTPADFHTPMYMIANLMVGSGWTGPVDSTTPFPSSFQIDYIRVYEDLGAPPPPPPPPQPPIDFDHSGQSDVLWQNDDGRVAVWLMNGTTLLDRSMVGPNPGPDWRVKGTGDFNQDGRSDIIWQNDDGRAALWFLDGMALAGQGMFGDNPGPSWHVIDTGNFSADRKSDILWQNDDGRVAVWLVDGTAQIAAAVVGDNPGAAWHVKASGDFNGDGESDILWQNNDGRAAVWLLDGMNFVSAAVVSDNPGPSWHIKDSGDFNGDGKFDILWQNDDGRAGIWFLDGLALLRGSVVGSNPGPAWQAEAAADYNGDGMSDILWQHDNGQADIWLMSGFGVLDSGLVGPNLGPAWHVGWI
jgi:beta-glucanase (GH16 family)